MRPLALAALLGLALAGALAGCSISPAEHEAIRQAWGERDAERAAECRRNASGLLPAGAFRAVPDLAAVAGQLERRPEVEVEPPPGAAGATRRASSH